MNTAILEAQNLQLETLISLAEETDAVKEAALNRAYDETVVELLNALGEDAPAADIDIGEYVIYMAAYVASGGMEDTETHSYRRMIDWLENHDNEV